MLRKDHPLIPKNPDGILRVISIGRLSKPKNTEEDTNFNLASSYAAIEAHLREIYDGQMDIHPFAEQISGLIVDRRTIVEIEELIATGEIDLVITEDLSRIYRNPRHQWAFVQDAVDADVRVICFGDHLDTADENWEVSMGMAAFRHGLDIPTIRRRVRRTASFAFEQGGQVYKTKFGYRKLSKDEARSGQYGPKGLRIAKLAELTPTIKDMIAELRKTKCYAAVAEWLIENNVPTGPYVKNGWRGSVVQDVLTDDILAGYRKNRKQVFRRKFKTGKFERKRNPDPEVKHWPELAHLTKEEFADLKSLTDEIARIAKEPRSTTRHPRYQVRRTNSIFPAHHATCAICGELMYRYDADQLKCSLAHEPEPNNCWNHVQMNCDLTRRKVIGWMTEQLSQFPEARQAVVDFAWSTFETLHRTHNRQQGGLERQIADLERQAADFGRAIKRGIKIDEVLDEAEAVQRQLERARRKMAQRDAASSSVALPLQPLEVSDNLEAFLLQLAGTSFEFGDFMRKIFPEFKIVPIQAIDSSQVHPRAKMLFDPWSLVPGATEDDPNRAPIPVTFDLFIPPIHLRYLREVRQLLADNPKVKNTRIAEITGMHPMSVKRAKAIIRQMVDLGLAEPYRELTAKPKCAGRWKRRPKKRKNDSAA